MAKDLSQIKLEQDHEKEIEELKQKHKVNIIELQAGLMDSEHEQKMLRLEKLLEIAKAQTHNLEVR